MAVHSPTTSTFVAKLLAPLPLDVEQVSDKRYLRLLRRDADDVWRKEMVEMRRAYHLRMVHADSCAPLAFIPYVAAVDRQMRVPAATKAALRWKRQHRKLDGGRVEWNAQIAKDEAFVTMVDER